jgi:hypothetical protein
MKKHEQPKTESWAKFRYWEESEDCWVEPTTLARNLHAFMTQYEYPDCNFDTFHEVEDTRIDLPVVST